MYTKHACTQPLKTNCTVNKFGNLLDLSQLTKLNSNYEIAIDKKKKIVLNVCHSIINNGFDGVNCQFSSGVCLVDKSSPIMSNW